MRIVHKRLDYFVDLRDEDFFDRFRMSKETVMYVLRLIEGMIRSETNWNNAFTPAKKILLMLRYYASGSILVVCGDFMKYHKSTASRVIRDVSVSITLLRKKFIHFPADQNATEFTKQQFYNIAQFPRCVGAIDCTHVKIRSPGGPNAEEYRNRKVFFFSMNVQTVCDANLKIQNVVARWPGASHDSIIFKNSNIMARFERGEIHNWVLVGDSGYGVSRYLLTPLHNPATQGEILYNESLIRTRNTVERSYGVWKRRFPILALGINVSYASAQSIVVATAVLHNIATEKREKVPRVSKAIENRIQLLDNVGDEENRNRAAVINYQKNITRMRMILYFDALALQLGV